jgi:diadenosine tetraphosphate (Ap4A) HIT family hydrolase
MVVWTGTHVRVNHYLYESDANSGWLVISPRRHITRWFELTNDELAELAWTMRATDKIVTDLFGSARTMVASLGWLVEDHLHVHCVPTFDSTVALGHENFNGSYRGMEHQAGTVCQLVREHLAIAALEP